MAVIMEIRDKEVKMPTFLGGGERRRMEGGQKKKVHTFSKRPANVSDPST